jgi:arginyl-tRNA synthetase
VSALAELAGAVRAAAGAVGAGGKGQGRQAPSLKRPPKPDFGDYSSNVALLVAPALGRAPREVAEQVGERLRAALGERLERVEVAGPGFLNLFLADGWFVDALGGALDAGERFGTGDPAAGEAIDLEFVSANPTGPLTVAHGRHAAYGDSLARLLAFAGHRVHREFYVNDHGTQVRRLGESIRARARGEPVPEDGYKGDYVAQLIDPRLAREADVEELARLGVAACLERIEGTLERFGVRFDTWFHESSLHGGAGGDRDASESAAGAGGSGAASLGDDGLGGASESAAGAGGSGAASLGDDGLGGGGETLSQALAALEHEGAVYRAEGALWLRSTERGDDRDRVLVRSSGEHTYFASDIAYHQHKRARGFDRLIDVWGADHHGYVPRMKAAWEALGGDPGALEVVIVQFVHLLKRGERSSMSKRQGEFVTLDDLIEEIGVDAARFWLLGRSHDTTVELDLDLAREQSAENPVYYVQYAHARIASMLRKAGAKRVEEALEGLGGASTPGGPGAPDGGGEAGAGGRRGGFPTLHPAERTLIKRLVAFPEEVADAAERRAPHRIAAYALELAQEFTAFYRDCRVVGAEPAGLEAFRLALCLATQRTIASALGLLGVGAPESM